MSASLDQGPQPRAGALTIHRDHCETLDPRGLLTDGTVSARRPAGTGEAEPATAGEAVSWCAKGDSRRGGASFLAEPVERVANDPRHETPALDKELGVVELPPLGRERVEAIGVF